MKLVQRNYSVLIILLSLFLAPGIAAYFFYTHPQWLGKASTNKGVLLNPPVLLSSVNASVKNMPKWQLMLWSPKVCKESCLAQLDRLARIRLALGRRLYEVDVRLVLNAENPLRETKVLHTLAEEDIKVTTLSVAEYNRVKVLQVRPKIFIVNPDNYMVLAYNTSVAPEDVFHDIKQLLTIPNQTSR